jgi:hypothetical protein
MSRATAIVLAVIVSVIPHEAALPSESSLFRLFESSSDAHARREAELKLFLKIRNEQEASWHAYALARRAYMETLKQEQRLEMLDYTSGKTHAGTLGTDSDLSELKQALRTKYDTLYEFLDDEQRARADRTLEPAECGK